MSRGKSFIKTVSIYFVGSTLSKVISILLLPIYTKYLTPVDYGTYDVMVAYLNIATTILFLDIGGAALRFVLGVRNESDKQVVVSNAAAIFLVSAVVYSAFVLVVITKSGVKYGFFIYLYGLLSAAKQFYGYTARGLGKNKAFVVSGLIETTVASTLNIVLILKFQLGYLSLFLSIICAFIVQILFLESQTKVLSRFRPRDLKKNQIVQVLKFAAPLSLNYAGIWLLSSYSRVAISTHLSLYANGLYAVASKFSMLITLFSTSFLYAWQEVSFSQNGSEVERGGFFTRATHRYVSAIFGATFCFIAVVWFVFPLAVNEQYGDALDFVPLIILSVSLSVINGFLGTIFSNLMKTKYTFISTLVGAVTNVVLCRYLIDLFGINGASISLSAGFAVSILMRAKFLERLIAFRFGYTGLVLAVVGIASYSTLYSMLGYGNLAVMVGGLVFLSHIFREDLRIAISMVLGYLGKRSAKGEQSIGRED